MTEEQVQLAARLYDARRAVQSLCGDGYQRLLESWMRLVRSAMATEGKRPIPAMLSLVKYTADPFDKLWLMAAAVEVIEREAGDAAPSTPTENKS